MVIIHFISRSASSVNYCLVRPVRNERVAAENWERWSPVNPIFLQILLGSPTLI